MKRKRQQPECGMVSDRCWDLLGSIWIFTSRIGGIPYSWDRHRREMIPSSTAHVYIRFNLWYLSFYLMFLVGQCIYLRATGNHVNFSLTYASLYAVLLSLEGLVLTIVREQDCVSVGTMIVSYIKHVLPRYHPGYNPNKDPYSVKMEFGLFLIICTFIGMTVIFCLTLCFFPRAPMLICYIIPDEDDAPSLVTIPFCYALPSYFVTVISANVISVVAVFYGYGMYIVKFATTELRMNRSQYKASPDLRKPENIIRAYRELQIVQRQVNDLGGPFFFPTEVIATKVVIFSLFVLIKSGREMDSVTTALMAAWAFTGGGFWAGFLLMGGYLNFYGNKVLNSWKYYEWPTKQEKRFMGKFRKSCKPLQFCWGKTYVMRRLSVLKYIRSVSRGTLRALLALR